MVTIFNESETPVCYLCWMLRSHDLYCKRKNQLNLFKITIYSIHDEVHDEEQKSDEELVTNFHLSFFIHQGTICHP